LPRRSPKRRPMTWYCSQVSITSGLISTKRSSYVAVAMLQLLPIIFVMRHHSLNVQGLLLKVHASYEPVFIATNIEDQRSSFRCVIGSRKRFSYGREVLPLGVADQC